MITNNKTLKTKLLALLFACVFILAAGCQNSLRANINIKQTPSEKFSSVEIDAAIDCVITQFNKEFNGNTLTDVWYDEERSERLIGNYLVYGENNAIALLSNIKSGGSDLCGGFDPNQTYSDFGWILIRSSEDSEWTVKTSGY